MKFTLSKKLYGLVGLMSLMMLIGTGAAVYSLRSMLGNYHTLVTSDVAQYSAAMEAQVALGIAVQGTKNYMTRMDQDNVKEFKDSIEKIKAAMQTLGKLADSDADRKALQKVEKESALFEQKGNELVAATLSGKDAVSVDAQFKGFEVPLRAALTEMGDLCLKAQKANFARDASTSAKVQWLFVVTALGGIAFAFVFATVTIRKIVKSVTAVSDVTTMAATGDMTKDVLVLSDDEVGLMGQGFNRMMETCAGSRARSRG